MEQHDTKRFDQWAIVELMGHQMIAGHVTEEVLGGATMLRVDVPERDGVAAFTKYVGASAIYGISPCSESAARIVAEQYGSRRPVSVWMPEVQPQLPAGTGDGD